MNYKICVIVCYFGKFPSYFNLWLKSCSYNPTVDFIIYSDAEWKGDLPENVRIINTTLEKIKERTEEIVGFEVSLNRAYRLCDFRPLFGEIFKEDLKAYDFWGYCDLDIIIGDIRKFITDDLLQKYDKINRWGHLSFHRNSEECNTRYKMESTRYSYKEILTRTRDFGFDEFDYTFIYQKYGYPLYILPDSQFADIRGRHKRFRVQGKENYDSQVFYWKNGHVYREYNLDGAMKKQEFLYIHFKKRGNLTVHFSEENVESFYITNIGFYKKNEEVNQDIIEKYNKFPGKTCEYIEDYVFRIKEIGHKFKRKYFD